jgi:hypothetical protein
LALAALAFCVLVVACAFDDDEDTPPATRPVGPPVHSVLVTEEWAGFFDAPFPSESMRRADGTVRWGLLPNPAGNPLVESFKHQADAKTRGFSRLGPIYLPFDGPVEWRNVPPTLADSMAGDSPVRLVNVDPSSPRYGERVPFYAAFQTQPDPYVPANLLKILPYQGMPLAPNALYAAVVFSSLGGADGRELLPADALVVLRDGGVPEGAFGPVHAEAFASLWDYLDEADIPRDTVAAATVFRAGEFVSETKALQRAAAAMPDPVARDLSLVADYPDYYVVGGVLDLPIWQDGERCYWLGGGEIHFENGAPIPQWTEAVRFAVSVPKRPMPERGYPLLFYANGQGGTYTQVFDRGPLGGGQDPPGTGPGWPLATRGIDEVHREGLLDGRDGRDLRPLVEHSQHGRPLVDHRPGVLLFVEEDRDRLVHLRLPAVTERRLERVQGHLPALGQDVAVEGRQGDVDRAAEDERGGTVGGFRAADVRVFVLRRAHQVGSDLRIAHVKSPAQVGQGRAGRGHGDLLPGFQYSYDGTYAARLVGGGGPTRAGSLSRRATARRSTPG